MTVIERLDRQPGVAVAGAERVLRLGDLEVSPPVVLAPMAGVTNPPFRDLCRQFGAGLYVSEMITARGLVEGNERTMKLAEFAPGESPRSMQVYGTEPNSVGQAVRWLVEEHGVDHVDLNFGCPARKITRKGGGAAVPLKPRLLASITRAAVHAAGAVPVTIKVRKGIDETHTTFLDAGRVAEETGCAAIAVHARTAAQLYSGRADWSVIAELKDAVTSIPVLGNGDIWEATDAIAMMDVTGCDGVVVGRGCLGRPWLFRDLAAAFAGGAVPSPPTLGEIGELMIEHAQRLVEWREDPRAMVEFRKHASWYVKGYSIGSELRSRLMTMTEPKDLTEVVAAFDPTAALDPAAMRSPRGKRGGVQKVALPAGYLDDLDSAVPPCEADDLEPISGG